jgi:Ca2+-binding RTX toxin-like protein
VTAAVSAATLISLLVVASPALGSRAFLEPQITKYEAGSGEANHVTISDSNGPGGHSSPNFVEIADSGAEITAQWGTFHAWGCEEITLGKNTEIDPHRVWCAVEGDKLDVTLGDLDDSFSSVSLTSVLIRTRVFAGAGDDVVSGGPASDLLFGGANADILRGGRGADVLSGGDGIDTVDYSNRTDPIGVSLPEPVPPAPIPPVTFEATQCYDYTCVIQEALSQLPVWPVVAGNDGELGEGDDIQADVENVYGGTSDDTLLGSEAANELYGHPGSDWLWGHGGDDTLKGGPDRDHLIGQFGNDRLRGGPGPDYHSGEYGDDQIDSCEIFGSEFGW